MGDESSTSFDAERASNCLLSQYHWIALAGDSHMRMIFRSLAMQLVAGLPTRNFSSTGAWACDASLAGRNISKELSYLRTRKLRYSAEVTCIGQRANGRDDAARASGPLVALRLSTEEQHLLNSEPAADPYFLERGSKRGATVPVPGALASLVDRALHGRRGVCLSYSMMLVPTKYQIDLLYGHSRQGSGNVSDERAPAQLRRPDVLIANPAVWASWTRMALGGFKDGLAMLLRAATAATPAERRTAAGAAVATAARSRRIVLWSSTPSVPRNLPAHKANITHGPLAAFALAARKVALAHKGAGAVAFVDALAYGTAGARAGRFAVPKDGLHWQHGSCSNARRTARDGCMLFREAARERAALYSCLWDTTLAFICPPVSRLPPGG